MDDECEMKRMSRQAEWQGWVNGLYRGSTFGQTATMVSGLFGKNLEQSSGSMV